MLGYYLTNLYIYLYPYSVPPPWEVTAIKETGLKPFFNPAAGCWSR